MLVRRRHKLKIAALNGSANFLIWNVRHSIGKSVTTRTREMPLLTLFRGRHYSKHLMSHVVLKIAEGVSMTWVADRQYADQGENVTEIFFRYRSAFAQGLKDGCQFVFKLAVSRLQRI